MGGLGGADSGGGEVKVAETPEDRVVGGVWVGGDVSLPILLWRWSEGRS